MTDLFLIKVVGRVGRYNLRLLVIRSYPDLCLPHGIEFFVMVLHEIDANSWFRRSTWGPYRSPPPLPDSTDTMKDGTTFLEYDESVPHHLLWVTPLFVCGDNRDAADADINDDDDDVWMPPYAEPAILTRNRSALQCLYDIEVDEAGVAMLDRIERNYEYANADGTTVCDTSVDGDFTYQSAIRCATPLERPDLFLIPFRINAQRRQAVQDELHERFGNPPHPGVLHAFTEGRFWPTETDRFAMTLFLRNYGWDGTMVRADNPYELLNNFSRTWVDMCIEEYDPPTTTTDDDEQTNNDFDPATAKGLLEQLFRALQLRFLTLRCLQRRYSDWNDNYTTEEWERGYAVWQNSGMFDLETGQLLVSDVKMAYDTCLRYVSEYWNSVILGNSSPSVVPPPAVSSHQSSNNQNNGLTVTAAATATTPRRHSVAASTPSPNRLLTLCLALSQRRTTVRYYEGWSDRRGDDVMEQRQDPFNWALCQIAACGAHTLEIVQSLFAHKIFGSNDLMPCCVQQGAALSVVQWLLQQPGTSHVATMYLAWKYRRQDVIHLLVMEHRLDLNVLFDGKLLWHHFFFHCEEGDVAAISILRYILINGNADLESPLLPQHQFPMNGVAARYALEWACRENRADLVHLLVVDCRVRIDRPDVETGEFPIHMVTHFGRTVILEILILQGNVDVNAPNRIGKTALHVACMSGDLGMVKVLVLAGKANTHQTDVHGLTPIQLACHYRRTDIVQFLVQHHGRYSKDGTTLNGLLILDACGAWSPSCELVKCLVDTGMSVDIIKEATGETPLHLIASKQEEACSPEMIRLLVGSSVNGSIVNKRDKQGRTALHLLCQRPTSVEAAKVLVVENSGAVDLPDCNGRTALHVAAELTMESPDQVQQVTAIIETLIGNAKTCDIVDADGYTPFLTACRIGGTNRMHVLSSLITVGRASTMLTTTTKGETALHLACQAIHPTLELVRYLVANCGVNVVNQPDHDGKTPLHVACVACPRPSSHGFTFKLVSGKRVRSDQSECLNIVRFLVCEAKADTNLVDKDGKTALDLTHLGSAGPNESVAQIMAGS